MAIIEQNVLLASHTSYKVGGPADYYCKPTSEEEVVEVYAFVKEKSLPLFILGRGSNLLVSDKGYRGVVLDTTALNKTTIDDTTLTVMAGASLTKTVVQAVRHNLAGMEELAGIPGTVGGGVMMNAGAYGQTISDRLVSIRWLPEGSDRVIESSKEELEFGYRYSSFKKSGGLIISATFELEKALTEDLLETIETIQAKRSKSQPLTYPSCGSVFKRPPNNYAGALIEKADLKGTNIGGAEVSEKHANFIINRGGATAKDIRSLINLCRERVYEVSGILLESEVIPLGEFEDSLWETVKSK